MFYQAKYFSPWVTTNSSFFFKESWKVKTSASQTYWTVFLLTVLFLVPCYILAVTTLMSPQTRLITVSNITPLYFNHLRLNYGQTLSCPCTIDTIPYSNFVSNNISFDPVCSSIFTSRQWIEALYITNASRYLVYDFRTTASSQVNQDVLEQIYVVTGSRGKSSVRVKRLDHKISYLKPLVIG